MRKFEKGIKQTNVPDLTPPNENTKFHYEMRVIGQHVEVDTDDPRVIAKLIAQGFTEL